MAFGRALVLGCLVACGGLVSDESALDASADASGDAAIGDAAIEAQSLDDPNRAPFSCATPSTPSTNATKLAQFPSGDVAIAIDDTNVYFTDEGESSVGFVARSGGAAHLSGGVSDAVEVHLHGQTVCFRATGVSSTTFLCSSTTAFAPKPVVTVGGDPLRISYFDFDDHDIYYPFPPNIFSVPIDGSAPPTVFATDDAPQQPFSPMAVTVVDGVVFWASINHDNAGSIKRCNAGSACTPQVLATFEGATYGSLLLQMAVSSGYVYWDVVDASFQNQTYSKSDVYRVPIGGGNVTHLAACGEDFSNGNLAVDDQAVYWISRAAKTLEPTDPSAPTTGAVWKLPLDGSPAAPLVGLTAAMIGGAEPPAIAAGGGAVFWITNAGFTNTLWSSP